MNKLKSLMHGALAPVLVLLVWEACARRAVFGRGDAGAVGSGGQMVGVFAASAAAGRGQSYLGWLLSGELLHDAYSSLYRVIAGFVIGAGLALPAGLC